MKKKSIAKSPEMYPIKEISDAEMVFSARDVLTMMPEYKDIPEEYKMNFNNKAFKFICDWFYKGLTNPQFVPREGVDPEKAFKHISAIMSSWAPKHQHKMAGCAWLLDQWFSSYEDNDA